jgi:hypothetical protein
MKILSLDMGKFKTVWLVYLTGGVGEKQYGKIATGPKEVHDLLVEHQPDRLVLESGPSAGWVCDIAAAFSIPAQVANTNDERWHWKKSKKKTDRIDVGDGLSSDGACAHAQGSAMAGVDRVSSWSCGSSHGGEEQHPGDLRSSRRTIAKGEQGLGRGGDQAVACRGARALSVRGG